ncbi:MAG: LysR family transcriptional regulator [Bauldia sp.]|nr:LysR family transcriptional regulator [Bauldia sp.]
MDWNDLRFVLAVARQRTLAAAGQSLGVDPTTVGRRIISLETALGARLYDRTGDGYLPTAAGHAAVARAEKMEQIALSLADEIEGIDGRVAGPVQITALDALFDAIVIPHVGALLGGYPELELTFSSAVATASLERREADVAIRTARPQEPYAVARHLGRAAMAAYVAVDRDFGPMPPLVGLPRSDDNSFSRALEALFPGSRVVVRANAERHMLSLVRAGAGVGLIDCFVGDRDPALRRVWDEPVSRYDLWAAVHVDMHKLPRVRVVMDFLSGIFAEERDRLEGMQASV